MQTPSIDSLLARFPLTLACFQVDHNPLEDDSINGLPFFHHYHCTVQRDDVQFSLYVTHPWAVLDPPSLHDVLILLARAASSLAVVNGDYQRWTRRAGITPSSIAGTLRYMEAVRRDAGLMALLDREGYHTLVYHIILQGR